MLNDRPGVADATRRAVLTAIDVLGYDRPARLRPKSALLVGLVMPELVNPIFPAFAQVIETALAAEGFTPVLCTQTPGGVHEDDYVQMLIDRGVSGIIFLSGLGGLGGRRFFVVGAGEYLGKNLRGFGCRQPDRGWRIERLARAGIAALGRYIDIGLGAFATLGAAPATSAVAATPAACARFAIDTGIGPGFSAGLAIGCRSSFNGLTGRCSGRCGTGALGGLG